MCGVRWWGAARGVGGLGAAGGGGREGGGAGAGLVELVCLRVPE